MADVQLADLVGPIGRRDADTAPRPAPSASRPGRVAELRAWLAAAHASEQPHGLDRVRAVLVDDGGVATEKVQRIAEIVGAALHVEAIAAAPAAVLARAGAALAEGEADAGTDLLVVSASYSAPGPATSALIALLTGKDASLVTDTDLDDRAWMAACAEVRDAMRLARPVLGEQLALLDTVGAREAAFLAGLLLGAAARRTPVLLDGVVASSGALVAHRASFRAADWWLAGDQSAHPAHALALQRIGLTPLLDLGAPAHDAGTALLAVPLLRAAAG